MTTTWIKGGCDYPKRWPCKGAIDRQLNPGERAVRINFPFEIAWIVINERNAALMENGGFMECWDFYLNQHGHVMGPRDFQTAANTPMHGAWLAAAQDRCRERIRRE